jgi:hypothetical protein
MPSFDLGSGLPTYPAGLSDREVALVLPLYRAIAALTQQASVATGNVTYSPSEQAQADQFGKLISQRMNKIAVRATVALGFGKLVNLHLVAGVVEARLADATPGIILPAHGVVDSPAGIAAGAWGEIIFMTGRSTGISGTVFGSRYFLSTAGNAQLLAPTAPGALVQLLGVGLGSAGFFLQIVPGGA